MSGLSGYDSEVVGFDSIPPRANQQTTSAAQTTEYSERAAAAQTCESRDVGCTARPDEPPAPPPDPPGLASFLRRVTPLVMEQLDRTGDFLDSSDSDEEEAPTAKLLQEIPDRTGSGDHEQSVLSVSWSGGGNSFAVSYGQLVHDTWCQTAGRVQVYTYRRSDDSFAPSLQIAEKSCVSVVRHHPGAALLAYGTAAGEVVLWSPGAQLAAPPHCHAARRVSALHWADAATAELFLLMQVKNKQKRRGAADQVLVSSGASGTVNAWQVNAGRGVFESIVSYTLRGSRGPDAPDITCFDFMRCSLRAERAGVFVAGTSTGRLLLCRAADAADPVVDELAGHAACVLNVAFSPHRPAVFLSLSMDSQIRVYDVDQGSPIKVVTLDATVSCVSWLQGACAAVGLAGGAELLRVVDLVTGRALSVAGLAGSGDLTCLDVTHRGTRLAAGDKSGTIRVWELPPLRNKWSCDSWM